MAQPKNKKRRSRKRARTGRSGSAAEPEGARAVAPTPATTKVSKAQRAQKAREARKVAPGPPTVKADRREAPKPIWAPLPITELLIFTGFVTAVVGFVVQSAGLVLGGFAMIIISSLELALREHLAGYRSHSSLIAGVGALVVAGGSSAILNLTDVRLPQWPLLLVAVLVFAGAFRALRQVFKNRSGGLTYRV